MRKHTIIEHDTFKKIISFNPIVDDNEHEKRNALKMDMLNSIINAIGFDKWQRMKQETKSALEYLCFLSIERGFVWCSPEHTGERYNVNSATVRRYVSFLQKHGVVSRLWRSSTKHNGRGCMVVFFHVHPYFEKYWENQLFLDTKINSNVKAETSDKPSNINENDSFPDSTSSKPDIKDLKNKKTYTKGFISDNVNRDFVDLYSQYFPLDGKIYEYYKAIKQIAYKNCRENEMGTVWDVATHSFKQLIGKVKHGWNINRPIKKPVAYFVSILKAKFDELYFSELDQMDIQAKCDDLFKPLF
ncbi:hypothetical protein GMB86_11850 [Terrilactibacillus sp. BCM23-1]|uniref:Helix-turn-helix domain-containing protein n=1 Tax=Terrilactibacillus tamarindi TaxID=2599694 RepID=A0A6N8CSM6_9BACI|nr:hypothetical protein [Terrilactibacillus tamarindi]MTT32700.1 hypothetical protein [Terrilactibacillus tamarindi]